MFVVYFVDFGICFGLIVLLYCGVVYRCLYYDLVVKFVVCGWGVLCLVWLFVVAWFVCFCLWIRWFVVCL